MKRYALLLLCVVTLYTISCGPVSQNDEPTAIPGGGTVTLWTDHTELFMEFPALLVGKTARLAIHLTWLDTFKPVSTGAVRLHFQTDNGVIYTTQVDGPSSPGIYRPNVAFTLPGTYKLTMVIEGDRTDTLHVPAISVFASVNDIPKEEEGTSEEEIAFLKEQQWVIDFRTETVQTALLRGQIRAHGEIVPRLKSEAIVSAPFSGIVFTDENRDMPVTGSIVSKGSRLVTLTPSAQAMGDGEHFATRYTHAEHELALATTELDRMKRLQNKEAIPFKRVQEAEARLDDAETTLATLNRYVQRTANTDPGGADQFRITAPVGGTIVETYVIPGQQITTGSPLFRIIDMGSVWIRAYVPVTEIGRIQTPREASFRLPGFEQDFKISALNGHLVSLGSIVENQTRSIPIIYEVQNPNQQFRIGMFPEMLIAAGQERAVIAVPETALIEDEGRYSVFVQISGEAFARRVVQTGVRDQGMVEIISGLTAGEHVVTVGAFQVRLASLSTELPEHGHEH